MTRIRNQLLLTGALLSVCACKEAAPASSTESLDNMTRASGQEAHVNDCGVHLQASTYAALSAADKQIIKDHIDVSSLAKKPQADQDSARLSAAGALSAVPKAMQQMFFLAKGKILVVDDAGMKTYCDQSKMSAADKAFASEVAGGGAPITGGCWTSQKGYLAVVVSNNDTAIHHSLLRLFAYAYAQFFWPRLSQAKLADEETQSLVSKGMSRFNSQRHNLAQALLQDLHANNASNAKDFSDLAQKDAAAFETMVFAEAIDSYYCSPTTQHTYETQFKATWNAFTKGDLALTKDFGEPIY